MPQEWNSGGSIFLETIGVVLAYFTTLALSDITIPPTEFNSEFKLWALTAAYGVAASFVLLAHRREIIDALSRPYIYLSTFTDSPFQELRVKFAKAAKSCLEKWPPQTQDSTTAVVSRAAHQQVLP